MRRNTAHSHDMYDCKCAKERESDVKPPKGPKRVDEWFSAEVILLVKKSYGDVDEGGGAHGIAAEVQALHRMTDHNAPYVGEEDIPRKCEDVECNEKREVQEEEHVGENLERCRVAGIGIVVPKDIDGTRPCD